MMNIQRIIPVFIVLLILLFLPSLVAGKYIGKGYEHFLLFIGIFSVLYTNWKGVLYASSEERLVLFGVLAYLLALTGFFYQDSELTRFAAAMDNFLKALIPLVLFSLLYVAKVKKINVIFWGCGLATVVAAVMTWVAILQGLPRGGGALHGAAIIFGNLAMLFGVLSFVFATYYLKHKLFFLFLFFGLLGVSASLFSGTRGGWIVLVTLPFVLIPFIPKSFRLKTVMVIVGTALLLLSVLFFTDNSIKNRLFEAYSEISQMLSSGSFSAGSLGIRLELWNASFMAFLSSPLFGIGVGEFYAFKHGLFESGKIPENILTFKHSHSEYFSILSNMGLVGVVFYTVFFIWLWRNFLKAAYSKIKEVRLLGLAGISTIVCYLDFSLSESFFSSHLGAGAFYFLMTLFIYFINLYSKEFFCASSRY